MGEAESDPDTPRISPFKFINRPNLQKGGAQEALQNVDELIKQAHDNGGGNQIPTFKVIVQFIILVVI